MSMGEVICCNFGQCGVQTANAAWELYCIEHDVEPDGKTRRTLTNVDEVSRKAETKCLFTEGGGGCRKVPRALIADLEPTVVDEIRTGSYRNLFHPQSLINTYEDAANNFARGNLSQGKKIIEQVMGRLRRMSETCDRLSGFFLTSTPGGTGAGFTDLFLHMARDRHPKSDQICMQLVPSARFSTASMEPYNVVLAMRGLIQQADVVACFDNESLYRLCQRSVDAHPAYNHVNRLLAQVHSNLTCCYRFGSPLSNTFLTMQTNLVPYPRIHFFSVSHAPLVSPSVMDHSQWTVQELTKEVFQRDSYMCRIPLNKGHFISCNLQYRGAVPVPEINATLLQLKADPNMRFVDWNPNGFKVGVSSQATASTRGVAQPSKSVTLMANSTAIASMWREIQFKFRVLFHKRAFVHWFVGEGLEEGELMEAEAEMEALVKDHMNLETETETETEAEEEADPVTERENTYSDSDDKEEAKPHTAFRNSSNVDCFLSTTFHKNKPCEVTDCSTEMSSGRNDDDETSSYPSSLSTDKPITPHKHITLLGR